jgi:hypothetical protein
MLNETGLNIMQQTGLLPALAQGLVVLLKVIDHMFITSA